VGTSGGQIIKEGGGKRKERDRGEKKQETNNYKATPAQPRGALAEKEREGQIGDGNPIKRKTKARKRHLG